MTTNHMNYDQDDSDIDDGNHDDADDDNDQWWGCWPCLYMIHSTAS